MTIRAGDHDSVDEELPFDFLGVEDRAFDAGALPIPGAVGLSDFGDAAETDADAARHWRFQRDDAFGFFAVAELGYGFHHRLRPAADDEAVLAGRFIELLLQNVGDKSVVTDGAVVAGDAEVEAG